MTANNLDSNSVVQFLPLILIFAVLYWFVIPPQRSKRARWVAVSISGSGCATGHVTRLLCASAFVGTLFGFLTF